MSSTVKGACWPVYRVQALFPVRQTGCRGRRGAAALYLTAAVAAASLHTSRLDGPFRPPPPPHAPHRPSPRQSTVSLEPLRPLSYTNVVSPEPVLEPDCQFLPILYFFNIFYV